MWYSWSKLTGLQILDYTFLFGCIIIIKSWIQSFCKLIFFHLAKGLHFFSELVDRKPH